jgi:Putative collagen-binding domain of a collagenase
MTYDVTGAPLTVNMAQFKSAVTARWYDPTNGTYTTITGSPFANNGAMIFTPPGANSTGDPDWILVLRAGS